MTEEENIERGKRLFFDFIFRWIGYYLTIVFIISFAFWYISSMNDTMRSIFEKINLMGLPEQKLSIVGSFQHYLGTEFFGYIFIHAIWISFIYNFFVTRAGIRSGELQSKIEQQIYEDDNFQNSHENESSSTAKAGLVLGAAALAQANKKPKIPQIHGANNMRNISINRLRGNNYRVSFERFDGNNWSPDQRDIDPSISGFSSGMSNCNIRWS